MTDLANGLPVTEVSKRLERTRQSTVDNGMDGLLAYADAWRTANVGYFTDFRPLDGMSDIAMAAFLLPVDNEPTLFVGTSCLGWAEAVTNFPVLDLNDLPGVLKAWAAGRTAQSVLGLAGGALIPAPLRDQVTDSATPAEIRDTMVLARVKSIKSNWEVECLREAARLTDSAMEAIKKELESGPRTERELARAAEVSMLREGADSVGYRSMVQAGPRSCYNLALPTDRPVREGDLVMTDIGARYNGYVADGGRGFGYSDIDAPRKSIIEASASAVETGLQILRPGIAANQLNEAIQGSLLESGYGDYSNEARGHGTGHGTGMDPEEELPWIGPGEATVLEENMVFTLKATITVPGVGGVRSERIVRVTAQGCEALDEYPMRLSF